MNSNLDAAKRLIQDHDFRQKLRQHDADALAQIGYVTHSDAGELLKFKVITSTQDITYVPMPEHVPENYNVPAEELSQLQAAGTGGTAGTAGSASSMMTVTTTVSSGGCVGSIGTVGSAG